MNILQIQDDLKNFSEEQLINEMQRPSGNAPQYLVLSEINRRKRVKSDFEASKAADTNTVAEEAVASAGVPAEGMRGMAEAMAPRSESSLVAQPQGMRTGGLMNFGREINREISEDVSPFLDEVANMAENRFNIKLDSMENQFAQMRPMIDEASDVMPRPAVMDRKMLFGGDQPSRNTSIPFARLSGISRLSGLGGKGRSSTIPFNQGGIINARTGLSIADRNQNPGNLRLTDDPFFGTTGQASGYATFASPEYGLRGIALTSDKYAKEGVKTIKDYVEKYAPKKDKNLNNKQYAKLLADSLGVGVDDEIDFSDDNVQRNLIPAIAKFEGYKGPLDSGMVDRAVAASGEKQNRTKVDEVLSGIDSFEQNPKNYGIASSKPNFMSAMASGNVNVDKNKIDVGLQEALKKNPQYSELGDEFPTFTTSEKNQNMEGEFGKAGLGRPNLNLFQKISRKMGGTKYAQPGEIVFESPYGTPFVRDYDPSDEKMGDKSNIPYNVGIDKKGNFIEETVSTDDPVDDAASLYAEDLEEKEKARIKAEEAEKNKPLTLDEQLASMQEDLKKSRNQDKWLAIAQAGLSIMASDKPTLGGAIGEGASVGLQAYRDAQERYNEGVIDVLNARAKLAKSKASSFGVDDALNRVIGLSNTIAKLEEQRTKLVEFPSDDNKKRIEAIDQELRQARQLRDKIQKTYTGIVPIQIPKSELNASLGKG